MTQQNTGRRFGSCFLSKDYGSTDATPLHASIMRVVLTTYQHGYGFWGKCFCFSATSNLWAPKLW